MLYIQHHALLPATLNKYPMLTTPGGLDWVSPVGNSFCNPSSTNLSKRSKIILVTTKSSGQDKSLALNNISLIKAESHQNFE